MRREATGTAGQIIITAKTGRLYLSANLLVDPRNNGTAR